MATHRRKLCMVSALATALLPGLGCQAGHLYPAVHAASKSAPASVTVHDHTLVSSRYWNSTPGARVFRGSASAVSEPSDLTAQ